MSDSSDRADEIISSAPQTIRPVLRTLLALGEDTTPTQIGAALEPLRNTKPSRRDWQIARELLIRAVRDTGAVSAPARFVDEYLMPTPMQGVEVRPARDRPQRSPAQPADGEDWPAWPDEVPLAMNRYGEVRPTLANALLFVRFYPGLRGRLRYNERWIRPEWSSRTPWGRQGRDDSVNEEDAVEAATWISSAESVGFGKEALLSSFLADAYQRPFDPVRAYLDGLQWDETERVSSWLTDHFGVKATKYSEAIGKAWLIAAVARVYDPGCQVDHMLILEGAQSIGKSQSLRALAGEFYADISFDQGDKDLVQSIHGPWVVEWSELSGMSRRESESLKAFVSRQIDRFRPPYGRSMKDLPRRCVFAGSTNERTYLNDPTGGRRYWPVQVERADPQAISEVRDQIWAEAVRLYRANARWWLEQDLEAEAAKVQRGKMLQDTWDDHIAKWLQEQLTDYGDFIPTADILYKGLDLPSSSQTTATGRRLAAVMKRLGWVPASQRIEGRRQRGYKPSPDPAEEIEDEFEDNVPF